MLVDVNRCAADCNACVAACDKENGLPGGKTATSAQWIRKVELKDARGAAQSLPMMCQHCAEPPCVDVCPTGASFKRADGIVLVDRHTCIGCRYCMMACPYRRARSCTSRSTDQKPDVPRGKGCVESCTLCVHRIDRDRIPACVEACAAEGHKAHPVRRPQRPGQRDLAADRRGRRPRRCAPISTSTPAVRYQGL